jgi:hypothetical protein
VDGCIGDDLRVPSVYYYTVKPLFPREKKLHTTASGFERMPSTMHEDYDFATKNKDQHPKKGRVAYQKKGLEYQNPLRHV